jgi:hypothetical protein
MNPSTETTLRFTGDFHAVPVLLVAFALAALMLWLYRREIRFQPGRPAWLPAILRSLAVFLLVLAVAGPVLRHITTYRQLGRVVLAVDASSSMKLTDEAPTAQGTTAASGNRRAQETRWQRAQHLLLEGNQPLLKKLIETQDVELSVLRGLTLQRLWWHRQNGRDTSGPMPANLEVQPDAPNTNLDQTLRDALASPTPGTAIVLLSDGQHNTAGSPEEFATAMKEAGIPVFTVGFGTEVPPADLSLVDVLVPESVFNEERLQGRLTLRDSMPPGIPALVRIECQGKKLWEQTFNTDGKGERSFDFNFPVRELPGALANEKDKTLRNLTVQVAATGDQAVMEKTRANNAREVALHLLTKKRKLLILDGRPRWETRYIHNHFDRDDRWQVQVIFDDFAPDVNSGALATRFPSTKDELMSHDIIIIGDLPPSRLKPGQVTWLSEFVERRGGGLIFVDGARGHLSAWEKTKLLPVTRRNPPGDFKHRWQLAPDGETLAALRLSDSSSANSTLWPTLSEALWIADAQPLPGSSVLANFSDSGKPSSPAIVFRSFGAGAVLYVGSDDLWRWRYQVADLYHQRLWMQLAAWIAAPPFQAESKTISLGTDHLRHAAGERAEIRVRLRKPDGSFITDGSPRAFLMHHGSEAATLSLEPDPTHAGVYRALTPPLKPGAYEIAIAENPTAARAEVRLSLRVNDSGSQELSSLTMNRTLLETMALNSGGRFLREEQAADELPNLLQTLDRKQTITRETILWSSWWWFAAVITLLTIEWLLRKRLRLV